MTKNIKRIAQFAIFLLLLSCDGAHESKSIDDMERPADWSAHWEFILEADSVDDAIDEMVISDFSTSKPIDELAEQLYQLAFSGDATIHSPDLFGEMDATSDLDPKALLNELESYDTVLMEDLLTGEFKDTVIDNTFSLEKASAMVLSFDYSSNPDLLINANALAFGVQVFDETTGKRRGNAKKFYIKFRDPQSDALGTDQLMLYTDSLGMFFPHSISIYKESTKQSFAGYVKNTYGTQALKLSLDVSISFKTSDLIIENAVLKPIGKSPI